jgi:hypothetical protein
MARTYIVNDCCPHYWVEVTVTRFLPQEAKSGGHAHAGRKSAIVRGMKKKEESKEFDRDFPELRNETPQVKKKSLNVCCLKCYRLKLNSQ